MHKIDPTDKNTSTIFSFYPHKHAPLHKEIPLFHKLPFSPYARLFQIESSPWEPKITRGNLSFPRNHAYAGFFHIKTIETLNQFPNPHIFSRSSSFAHSAIATVGVTISNRHHHRTCAPSPEVNVFICFNLKSILRLKLHRRQRLQPLHRIHSFRPKKMVTPATTAVTTEAPMPVEEEAKEEDAAMAAAAVQATARPSMATAVAQIPAATGLLATWLLPSLSIFPPDTAVSPVPVGSPANSSSTIHLPATGLLPRRSICSLVSMKMKKWS